RSVAQNPLPNYPLGKINRSTLPSQVIRFSGQKLPSLLPDCCRISLRGNRRIKLKWEANYWRAQHACLGQRETAPQAQVEALEAQVRDLHQRLYGTKSEKSAGSEAAGQSTPASPRHRGQQPGMQGHGRSDRSALPVVVEVHDLSDAAKYCPQCGAAFAP